MEKDLAMINYILVIPDKKLKTKQLIFTGIGVLFVSSLIGTVTHQAKQIDILKRKIKQYEKGKK